MNMKLYKKMSASILGGLLAFGVFSIPAITEASDNTCIMLKFDDDTRFDRIETANSLSDLIMEKLINSGKFNFKETKPIPQNMEEELYNEKIAEFRAAKAAMDSGDYNTLFESESFLENRAQSIATARQGQFVAPHLTSAIGNSNGAEYLIQGTILNLGNGDWLDNDTSKIAGYASLAISQAGAAGAGALLGPLGMLGSIQMKVTGIGIQADVRVIKAATGEVVWQQRIMGKDTQKQYSIGMIKVGSDKLNNEMYFKAVDATAQLIADTLIAEADAGNLFKK